LAGLKERDVESDDPNSGLGGSYTGGDSAESVNRSAWTEYGRFQLDRGYQPPDADEIHWGWQGAGPGTGLLGDIAGKRVLDLGSGCGHHAAHLARDHHAQVDAIDISPTQHQRALAQYGAVEGLRFVLGDAIEHVHQAEPYDVVYSVHGLGFIDPAAAFPPCAPHFAPEAGWSSRSCTPTSTLTAR
jgi:2-polyprenyl-3-methyl-5-hydroxy-6-metoxy-1,4-benzoquinol methylase